MINHRGLFQAENIKKQLRSLTKAINIKVVEKSFKNDPIYKIFTKKGKKNFDVEQRVAMCLCSAFFFNSARRIHRSSGEYLLMSEGQKVNMDENSAFSIRDSFPEFLIFTELSGISSGILMLI